LTEQRLLSVLTGQRNPKNILSTVSTEHNSSVITEQEHLSIGPYQSKGFIQLLLMSRWRGNKFWSFVTRRMQLLDYFCYWHYLTFRVGSWNLTLELTPIISAVHVDNLCNYCVNLFSNQNVYSTNDGW